MSVRATAAAVAAGSVTAEQLTHEALARVAASDGPINAFTVVLADRALAEARRVDSDRRAGRPPGPLAGVPVAVKDHVWLAGAPATNGSLAYRDFVPDVSCGCVDRLIAADAIVIGKTNNPEFCYRGFTDNAVYGLTRNPRDLSRTPGGSSGGAGASVAAGMVPIAVGTDGGGSIRIPSSFCGVYGIKSTHGVIATTPGFLGWPSLSVTGPIAGSVDDLTIAFAVMAGLPVPAAETRTDLVGLRIAVSADLGVASIDPDVRAAFGRAVDRVGALGAEVRWQHPPPADVTAAWDTTALVEGYASEGPLLERWAGAMTPTTADLVRAGADITAEQYARTQSWREQYAEVWEQFFLDVDVLLTPTMPTTAFEVGLLGPATIDGVPQGASFDDWCALALPANLTGLPAVSVPIPTDGLPIGLQLMGGRGRDLDLLRIAAVIAG